MSAVRASGFFVARTPLLPLGALLELGDGLAATGGGELDSDLAEVRRRLRELASRPEVRDALYVASPEFDGAVERWLAGGDDLKLEVALLRYLARMSGRATPFGLCAGWSTGAIGAGTCLRLAAAQDKPHSRLDMDYLYTLVESLAGDPDLRAGLPHRPNSWLYFASGRMRYVEARVENGRRVHRLVAVEPTEELLDTLARAGGGADTRSELAEALVGPDVTLEDALAYVDELIDARLLIADIALPVTGPEPARPLASRLRALAGGGAAARLLDRVAEALHAADAAPAGERSARSLEVVQLVGELSGAVDPARLVQVDLQRPAPGARIPAAVTADLARGIELLRRLSRRREPGELRDFRERFAERYGTRAVRLVEALDPESGIGFGPDASRAPTAPPDSVEWGAPEQLLLRLATEVVSGGAREVDLASHEANILESWPGATLPDAYAAVASLAAASDAAVDRGEFEVRLIGTAGPSGASMLGRFCHADPELLDHVRRHLREEEALDPGAVFAEIAHLPEGRTGNVLARPHLRDHEIVLVAGSDAPFDRRIALDDLVLALIDDGLELRSQRLGRRIVPRLTSAHSLAGPGLGLYRLLGMLQWQGVAPALGWDWGPLAGAVHLPRVRLGRVVLALERWRITPGDQRRLVAGSTGERFAAVQDWRGERGLGRLVGLDGPDAALPVDLDNPHSVELLLRGLDGSGATIVEWWPDPERLAIHGPAGRHVSEIVVPFTAGRPARAAATSARASSAGAVRRSLPPGSEWIYLKLYCGQAAADRLLVDDVGPLADRVAGPRGAARWHFIRYADPHPHLRVRFGGEPAQLHSAVLPAVLDLCDRLVADGRAWRAVLDTYEREVERYGGPAGIELAEACFHADSDAVVAMLACLPAGEAAARERWRAAVIGTALLLRDLGFDDAGAGAILARLRAGYRAERGVDRAGARLLGRRFREERATLAAALDAALDGEPEDELVTVLRRRSQRLAPIAAELAARERAGSLTAPLDEMAVSLLHMHVVRLMRSDPRQHELVVYDALDRLVAARRERPTAHARTT